MAFLIHKILGSSSPLSRSLTISEIGLMWYHFILGTGFPSKLHSRLNDCPTSTVCWGSDALLSCGWSKDNNSFVVRKYYGILEQTIIKALHKTSNVIETVCENPNSFWAVHSNTALFISLVILCIVK
jgi:hypothetical protein